MTKTERRSLMPECTTFIDDMRQAFPGLTIQYASENGHEWGERVRVVEVGVRADGIGFLRVDGI